MARVVKNQRSGLIERVDRVPPSQLTPAERAANWREAQIGMSLEGKLAEASRIVAEIEDFAAQRKKELSHEFGHPFAANSELSFIEEILVKATSAEFSVSVARTNGDYLAVTAFLRAFRLAEALYEWREEFALGDLIAPGVKQAEGGSRGGQVTAQNRRIKDERRWARWQAEALLIWKEHPHFNVSDAARAVKKRLGLADGVETIRKRINKLGR
nr:hypothetical protein [uncultured Brevundimonas sp.]